MTPATVMPHPIAHSLSYHHINQSTIKTVLSRNAVPLRRCSNRPRMVNSGAFREMPRWTWKPSTPCFTVIPSASRTRRTGCTSTTNPTTCVSEVTKPSSTVENRAISCL
uniref:(northern house mosquito) hypothetical protein n=1 Tax=Culex pipiens TaxID=7175 RepID=A0A8D8A9H0_CULPI